MMRRQKERVEINDTAFDMKGRTLLTSVTGRISSAWNQGLLQQTQKSCISQPSSASVNTTNSQIVMH